MYEFRGEHMGKKNRRMKFLIIIPLLIICLIAFCSPQDKEDELLIDLLGLEKGGYIVESIYVFDIDSTKGLDGYDVKKAIYAPVDEELSNAIMEQIESYTATTSIVEPPRQREGYLLFLDTPNDYRALWLFYSEEEQGYIIQEDFQNKTLLIKESKLFEIIDEAYKNSVLQ